MSFTISSHQNFIFMVTQIQVMHVAVDDMDYYIRDTQYTGHILCSTWWRHQMETFSALLAICAENSPVPGEFSTQRPVTRSFDVYFDLRPNKGLSKQLWGWWFETQSCPLWRHRNDSSFFAVIFAVYIWYRGWVGVDLIKYHNQFCLGIWICCVIYVTMFLFVQMLDVKPKLHVALYSYASLCPQTSMDPLMIGHNVWGL